MAGSDVWGNANARIRVSDDGALPNYVEGLSDFGCFVQGFVEYVLVP